MLSKTAEKKPSPNAVCHDAVGNCSTGMSDADITNASKKIDPLKARGRSFQFGRRAKAPTIIAAQTAAPINGNCLAFSGKL
jgi:hypothetical protein